MPPTGHEKALLLEYAFAYREAYAEGFEAGFEAGVSAGQSIAKQTLLAGFSDDDEIPSQIALWIAG
jgi:flagellar biosynthesis/type III secretory pathway protein FliH